MSFGIWISEWHPDWTVLRDVMTLLVLAIIGGEPRRFAPLIDLYRQAGQAAGHDPAKLSVAINSHGFIADSADEAVETFYPPYAEVMSKIGRERGWSAMTRGQFEALRLAGRDPDAASSVAR